VVEEIDWSVGRVIGKLEDLDLARKTLVVFTSDNGPWLIRGADGGSAGPLREGKGSTWEGGMRVPGIFWWPGLIRPAVVHGIGCTMDLYATCLKLAGAEVPADRIVDGLDLTPTLLRGGPSPRDHMIFYRGLEVHAVRRGPFKAHFLTRAAYGEGSRKPQRHDPPLLFQIEHDPGESRDVASGHPEEIEAIRKLLQEHESKLVRGECQLTR
jgi:arylsulfatase A-like enzyme